MKLYHKLLAMVALLALTIPVGAQLAPNFMGYFGLFQGGSAVSSSNPLPVSLAGAGGSAGNPAYNSPVPNYDTGALITHTAASAGVNGADQANTGGHGVNIVVNVTAITGTTPSLTVTLQGKDTASGAYYNILASAAISATGTTVLQVFPGATAAANSAANAQLPRTWRVISAIGGTTPAVTATVGASVIE